MTLVAHTVRFVESILDNANAVQMSEDGHVTGGCNLLFKTSWHLLFFVVGVRSVCTAAYSTRTPYHKISIHNYNLCFLKLSSPSYFAMH